MTKHRISDNKKGSFGSSAVLLDKDKLLIFKYLYYLVCS